MWVRSDIFNMFFPLFCPPPEGADKQLNDKVETGTEKQNTISF